MCLSGILLISFVSQVGLANSLTEMLTDIELLSCVILIDPIFSAVVTT